MATLITKLTYKPQGIAHYVLAILNELGETTTDKLRKMASSSRTSVAQFQADNLLPLINNGDIKQVDYTTNYTITNQGITKLNTLQDLKPVTIYGVAEQRTIKHNSMRDRPDYDGTEIDQTCMRPGAYDFLKYPSLIQGVRYYRKDAPQ